MILSMHQPEYLPYLGHIIKIAAADLHIFYDDVQYEQRGYQNRNRILQGNRWRWLTVPVMGKFPQKIHEVKIRGNAWRTDHFRTIRQCYRTDELDEIYHQSWENLEDLNIASTQWILKKLHIKTPTLQSKDLKVVSNDRVDRVIEICKLVGATTFISGLGAKKYLNEQKFHKNNIRVIYNTYNDVHTPPLSSLHYLLTLGPKAVQENIIQQAKKQLREQ